jgi:D-alanyl-D-alanine dipeptidase
MTKYLRKSILAGCLTVALTALAGQRPVLKDSSQLIVVTTADWNAVDGRLQLYQRGSAGGGWKTMGAPIAIVVGKAGMAWGMGVAPLDIARSASDPVKREGDHTSPAGIFRMGDAFGYAAKEPAGWKMKYVSLSPSTDCVDDSESRFYNQILDSSTVSPDWKSAEHMRDAGEAYRWGLVIQHNALPARPAGGSCVFMHIWGGPGRGTEGCTAMPEPQIISILGWLKPSANPLLVQMPVQQYRRLAKAMDLPAPPTAAEP